MSFWVLYFCLDKRNSNPASPGNFADSPNLAGSSLKEQLEFAKTKVPAKERSQTRVYLMATAGLRRLDKKIQEAVLDSCRNVLRASGFLFRDEWASVISGGFLPTVLLFSQRRKSDAEM